MFNLMMADIIMRMMIIKMISENFVYCCKCLKELGVVDKQDMDEYPKVKATYDEMQPRSLYNFIICIECRADNQAEEEIN